MGKGIVRDRGNGGSDDGKLPRQQAAVTASPGRDLAADRFSREIDYLRIELEEQNAELRRAEEESMKVMKRYADLYDSAPVGFFTLGRKGVIREANLRGAGLVGVERYRLIGRSFLDFVAIEVRCDFMEFLFRVFDGKEKESCKLLLENGREERKYVCIEAIAVDSGEEGHFAVIDISDRILAENILQARIRLLHVANSRSSGELLQATLDETEELTGSRIGFFHFVGADGRTLFRQAWSTRTKAGMCNIRPSVMHSDLSGAGVWADCLRLHRPVIYNDYAALNHRRGMPKGHAPVFRVLTVPIFRNEKVVAILGVGNKEHVYDDRDVATAGLLADLAWDIVEQKRAHEETLAAKENFASFFDLVPGLMCIASTDGFFRRLNPAWEKTLVYRSEELLGSPFLDFIHPDDRDETMRKVACLARGEIVENFTNRFRCKNGSYRWLEWRGRTANGSDLIYATAQDITERREAENALLERQKIINTLASEVAVAEDHERCRIAGELHDRVAQQLFLAKMKTGMLSTEPSPEGNKKDLEVIEELLGQAIQDIRTLIFKLRPPILAESGLEVALKWLAKEFKEDYGIEVSITEDNSAKPLKYEISYTIYQIVRELLLNIAKHAGTRNASISIVREDGMICVTVADDGIGFDVAASSFNKPKSGGYGIYSTRMKIEYLGGEMLIDSSPGSGTRVVVRAPIDT